ncbi:MULTISPECIES: hypothetical protein [unclassified Chamaesiphon]|uniref:hypothetical protein n=1 Tax=unclassified Chamaesiphon TaxID=2620921 RepID=UPI00286AA543|nr:MULTISPECIES: hypothetical protein [unclassified Chamaesiphon]
MLSHQYFLYQLRQLLLFGASSIGIGYACYSYQIRLVKPTNLALTPNPSPKLGRRGARAGGDGGVRAQGISIAKKVFVERI